MTRLLLLAAIALAPTGAFAQNHDACTPPPHADPATPPAKVALSIEGPTVFRSVGAETRFDGGNVELLDGAEAGLKGARLSITGGDLTIADDAVFGFGDSTSSVSGGNLRLSNGAAYFGLTSLSLHTRGGISVAGGSRLILVGSGVVVSGGSITFSERSSLLFDSGSTITVTGGDIVFSESAALLRGGTFILKDGGNIKFDDSSVVVLTGSVSFVLGKGTLSGPLAKIVKCEGTTCRTPAVADGTALVASGSETRVVSFRQRPELLFAAWENEIEDYLSEIVERPRGGTCGASGWGRGGVAGVLGPEAPVVLRRRVWETILKAESEDMILEGSIR